MSINETVLEMHFHSELISLIKTHFGIGNTEGSFNFYKYSPQRECFVGYDQAFIQSQLGEEELFQKMRECAAHSNYQLQERFFGFFLQYKVVKGLTKRSHHTPPEVTEKTHYRAKLDTKKNARTGSSQHELLYNLRRNDGAFVYYACPMLFDRSELYDDKPDLEKLRLVEVDSCPSSYSDNETHHIYFNTKEADPIWCSEPVWGTAITAKEMISKIAGQIFVPEHTENLISLINRLRTDNTKGDTWSEKSAVLEELYESLTIVHIGKPFLA